MVLQQGLWVDPEFGESLGIACTLLTRGRRVSGYFLGDGRNVENHGSFLFPLFHWIDFSLSLSNLPTSGLKKKGKGYKISRLSPYDFHTTLWWKGLLQSLPHIKMHFTSRIPFVLGLFLVGVSAEIATVPLIRLRESKTGGSEFVDEVISLDVYNKLGNLSEPFTEGPLQFRYAHIHNYYSHTLSSSSVYLRRCNIITDESNRITGDDYGTGANAVPHNAPSRQFVITLKGSLNITAIDKYENGTVQRGEERFLEAGDILLYVFLFFLRFFVLSINAHDLLSYRASSNICSCCCQDGAGNLVHRMYR